MDKDDIDKLTFFILRGKNKKEVFTILMKNYPITQAQIFNQSKMYRTHVGRTIRIFEEVGIVECINPDEKTYKLYKPTDKAKKIAENINELEKKI